MLRLLFILAVLLFIAAVGAAIVRSLRSAKVDWTGVAFAIGFVVLAFYLGHLTGMGLL